MPSIPEDELRRQIRDHRIFCFGILANRNDGTYTQEQFNTEIKKQDDKLVRSIRQYAAKARLDERKRVALDNYQGQTFSDATNYKYKFDKFVDNNERRIKQLKKGQK